MEGMDSKPWRHRSFTQEFKAEVVELCRRGTGPLVRSRSNTKGGVVCSVEADASARLRGLDREIDKVLSARGPARRR